MIVAAPGKILLTGAYAVLEGAPAVVASVNRYATAHVGLRHGEGGTARRPMREVAFATGPEPPAVNVTALRTKEAKLGLGSSAAATVAALGLRAWQRGEDLDAPAVREAIFLRAREAHAEAQGGGSGVDIAASVHGGVLRYELRGNRALVVCSALPQDLGVTVFWSGAPARTTALRAQVDALRVHARARHRLHMDAVTEASWEAAEALAGDGEAGDAAAFLRGAAGCQRALEALGEASGAPLVPPPFALLARLAEEEGEVFLPSGAGGGDVAVHLTPHRRGPTAAFVARAALLGMVRLDVALEGRGVHRAEPLAEELLYRASQGG